MPREGRLLWSQQKQRHSRWAPCLQSLALLLPVGFSVQKNISEALRFQDWNMPASTASPTTSHPTAKWGFRETNGHSLDTVVIS